ncbi:hypothetical protein GCM10009605_37280 [Nocardiopsis composta]
MVGPDPSGSGGPERTGAAGRGCSRRAPEARSVRGMEQDRVAQLAESVNDESPINALIATVALREEVERLLSLHVRRARAQGATWSEIAMVLGISKQAVHKKYGGSRRER